MNQHALIYLAAAILLSRRSKTTGAQTPDTQDYKLVLEIARELMDCGLLLGAGHE